MYLKQSMSLGCVGDELGIHLRHGEGCSCLRFHALQEKEEQEKEDQASSLSSAKSSEPVTSAQVAKKGYLFNGLWDFLERTIAAQGWRGLWNGYSFTFSMPFAE